MSEILSNQMRRIIVRWFKKKTFSHW